MDAAMTALRVRGFAHLAVLASRGARVARSRREVVTSGKTARPRDAHLAVRRPLAPPLTWTFGCLTSRPPKGGSAPTTDVAAHPPTRGEARPHGRDRREAKTTTKEIE